MTPRPKLKLKCPECGDPFDYSQTLGLHRLNKHGIAGTSHAVLSARKKKAAAAAALPAATPINEAAPPTKRKYTKRSELATLTASTKNGLSRNNGHHPDPTGHPFGITETAVAVAFGRFQELCASVSFEFDVPPRSIARQLGTLIARSYS